MNKLLLRSQHIEALEHFRSVLPLGQGEEEGTSGKHSTCSLTTIGACWVVGVNERRGNCVTGKPILRSHNVKHGWGRFGHIERKREYLGRSGIPTWVERGVTLEEGGREGRDACLWW